MNHKGSYLKCHSRQEQKYINNHRERLEDYLHNQKVKYNKQARIGRVTYKIKKLKA